MLFKFINTCRNVFVLLPQLIQKSPRSSEDREAIYHNYSADAARLNHAPQRHWSSARLHSHQNILSTSRERRDSIRIFHKVLRSKLLEEEPKIVVDI